MAGPWEKYQQTQQQVTAIPKGPWLKYAPTTLPSTPEPANFPIDFYVDTQTQRLSPEERGQKRDRFASVLNEIARPWNDLGYGAASGINRGLATSSITYDLMAKHYERQGGGKSEGLFARAAEFYEKNEAWWQAEFERDGINAFDRLLYIAGGMVGEMVPGSADFMLKIHSGLYIPYIEGEERGYQRHESHPAISGMLAAAETGTLGLLFRMIDPFKRYIKATILGTTFGVQEAIQAPSGKKLEGFARGMGTGLMLGLTSPSGRVGLRDIFPEAVPTHPALDALLREQTGIRERRSLADIEELIKATTPGEIPPEEGPKTPPGREQVPPGPETPPVTPAPTGEAAPPLTGRGEIRPEVVDRLMAEVKALPTSFRVRIPEKLSSAEQQELIRRGATFDVNRMGEPLLGYSQEAKARDLREAVTSKTPKRTAVPKAKKEPATFISWIRSKGGMHDPSLPGEMEGLSPRQTKVFVLNKKTGRPVDELTQQAISDGWLPEGSTTSDFLDALRTDIAAVRSKGERLKPRGGKVAEAAVKGVEEQVAKEEVAALTPEIEEAEAETGMADRQVGALNLKPGDQVPVPHPEKGEELLTVKSVDPKTGEVLMEDGQKFRMGPDEWLTLVGNEADIVRGSKEPPAVEPAPAEQEAPVAAPTARTYTPDVIRRSLPKDMSEAEKTVVTQRLTDLSDAEIAKLLRGNLEQIRRELAQKRKVTSRGVGAPGELFPDEAGPGQQMLYSGGPDTAGLFRPMIEPLGIWGKLSKLFQRTYDYMTIDIIPGLSRVGLQNGAREHASARTAVPRIIDNLLAKVFPETYRDPAAMSRFIDIINKDNVLGGFDSFLSRAHDALDAGDQALYEKWIGAANRVMETHPITEYDLDVRRARETDEFMGAVTRWQGEVVPFLDQLYNEMKRVDPHTQRESRGRHFDARINLLTLRDEGLWQSAMADSAREMPVPSSSSYRNPNVKPDPYDQMAHFTGQYSTDARAVLSAVVGRRWHEVTKIRFYDDLVRSGVAREATPGQNPPEGYKRLPIRIPETDRNGKTTMKEKSLFVPEDLVREIRDTLGTDLPLGQNRVGQVLINIQLTQIADLVTHTKNILSVVTRAQGAGDVWRDAVRKFPGIGSVDAVWRIAKTTREVLQDTPEIRAEIDRMARMGLIRPEFPLTGIQKVTRGQQIIHEADTAARMIMNRFFDNLVERNLAVDTLENRANFVNQIGNYNKRLMGPLMRAAAQSGLSPFIVAGRNFNRQGRWAVTGNPGVEAASMNAAVQMRVMNLLGTAALFTLPALLNYLTSGKMTGRPGTPLGAWDLGLDPDEKGKHKVIDMLTWTGARRGMRSIGLDAVSNGILTGDNINEIMGNALQDASQTAIHPWSGPAIGFMFKALTGKQLDIRGKMEAEKVPEGGGLQNLENFRAALESQNPLVYSVVRPLFQEMGLDQKVRPEQTYFENLRETFLKSPAGAAGFRDMIPPPTDIERVQKEMEIERKHMEKEMERAAGETRVERGRRIQIMRRRAWGE